MPWRLRQVIRAPEAANTTRRAIGRQIAWAWVAQIIAMAVQLIYSGITARLLYPAAFGQFAVASAVLSFGMLVLGSGLANSAARMTESQKEASRALSALGLLAGLVLSTAIIATAPFWARLWDQAGSEAVIRAVAAAGALAPWVGVLTGLLRNKGRIHLVVALTLAATVAGALTGAAAVAVTDSAIALAFPSGVTNVVFAAGAWMALRHLATPTWRVGAVRSHLRFAGLAQLDATISYFTFAVPQWLMSRTLGAATLGQWNRAIALGSVPIQSVTSAVSLVIYPRFRHHGEGGAHVKALWSALLISAGLAALPAGCVAAIVVPFGIEILLGPGWDTAAAMGGFLAFATTLGLLEQVLASALEASNNFGCLWPGRIVSAMVITVGTLMMIDTRSWVPLAAGFSCARLAGHLTSMACAGRRGLISLPRVLGWYAASLVAGVAVCCVPVAAMGTGSAAPMVSAGLLLGYLALLWRLRWRLPPVSALLV